MHFFNFIRSNRFYLLMHLILATALFSTNCEAKKTDAAERRFIQEGMGQAEVLGKIGPPDFQTSHLEAPPCVNKPREPQFHQRANEPDWCGTPISVEIWSYNPTSHDYQTRTTITFTNGVVTKISRDISR